MPKRARRGSGYIGERKDGLFVGQISMGKDADGKRRRIVVYGRTQGEVQEKLDSARALSGLGLASTDKTVGQYLDWWLEQVVKPSTKVRTHLVYSDVVRLYLKPGLGHILLKKLTAVDIQSFLTQLDQKKGQWGKPLTRAKTLSWAVLHGALKKAVRPFRFLSVNPAEGVEPPRVAKVAKKVWTLDQLNTFLSYAKTSKFYPAYLLALMGMRQGEIFGLHWEDVDLEKGLVYVRWALMEHSGKTLGRGEVKSDAGNRIIRLPSVALEELKRLKASATSEKVFPTSAGTYRTKSSIRKRFVMDVIDSGVPLITFHRLKHMNASILLAKGVDPRTVQGQQGHSTMRLVMELYGHAMGETQNKVADVMQEVLTGGGANP